MVNIIELIDWLKEMGACGQVRVVSVGKEGAAGEQSSAKAVECCCGT
ncbi:unnamed protein product [Anisakis simplex]|uniref:XdhC_CoxI domain-containing protein n=1 Tax=Anisakis simplex TaxID=6269 RepID=A0A0M3JEY5_ANISI|nr:unnamed protein product [Anisakis simplex]